jgi:2,4-dienoyl-CoA reductase-like NADH-dependent reductase (Old Yellow Enzyme family)
MRDARATGLFTPVKVGPLELPNRIVMSPMPRIRAGEGCVPSERMVRCGRGTAPPFNPIDLLRPAYGGTLLAVGGFNKATGEAALAAGPADLVVYARPFISNPDLVKQFRLDAPLNPWDVRTFYGGDDHGYTDYPTLAQQRWPGKAP